jgi:transcription elongation factor B subunit 2
MFSFPQQEIFVMVRRAKLTMFLDCTESTTVSELKKMIEGIAKKAPEDQKLFKEEQALDDNKTLGDYGFTNQTARPQSPAMIGLACKVEGSFDRSLGRDDCQASPLLVI